MVFVVSNTGKALMPTSEYRARKLMKKNRAKIYRYRPFTIMMLDREDGAVQPIEYKCDVGYEHTGVSLCSEKHEYLDMQADLLPDEKERHEKQKKTRRTRRNRLRYRKPRFDNRKKSKKKGWLAPSIRHKVEAQVRLCLEICSVAPVTDAYFEMGKFDTQALKAMQEGKPLPQGKDYQHGERYGIETLRAAVFLRDGHKCVVCGRGLKENAYLHMHHVGYWKKDRTDRLSNLATVCEQCHTPANHQKNGKLYGIEPDFPAFAGETFMTMIRWQMKDMLKDALPDANIHITYGAATKIAREKLHLKKSHANDAYSMGAFHPRHRTPLLHIKKVRRNDRRLMKFYDAEYIDARNGSVRKGKELFNGRISRNHKKDSENLHNYRKEKTKKGHVTIRRSRTELKPGSTVIYHWMLKCGSDKKCGDELMTVHGTHTAYRTGKKGTKTVNVEFTEPAPDGRKSANLKKCKIVKKEYNTGWVRVA